MGDLTPLIEEELNVKEVVYSANLNEYIDFSLKPNFAVLGKQLGSKLKLFSSQLAGLDPKDAVEKLESGQHISFDLDGEIYNVSKDDVLINIAAKEGFDVATENNLFIILDTNLTEELINEGFARECISRVQQMRKSKDLQMMDNIVINITGSEKFMNAVNIHLEYIKEETLALEIINQESEDMTEDVLNGENVKIGITKA